MEHPSPDGFLPFLDVLIHPSPEPLTSPPQFTENPPTPTSIRSTPPPPPTQQRTELSDLSLEEPTSTTSAPHNTWRLNCRQSDTSASSTYEYYHGVWTKHAADTSPLPDLNKPPDRLQTSPSTSPYPTTRSSLSKTLKKIFGQHYIKVTHSTLVSTRPPHQDQDYSSPPYPQHHLQNLLPRLLTALLPMTARLIDPLSIG